MQCIWSWIPFRNLRTLVLLGALAAIIPAGQAADGGAGDVRAVVEQWVAIEKTISEEASAWKEKERLLRDLISSARSERENLNAQIAEAKQTASAADQKRAELVSQRQELEASAEAVLRFLSGMEQRLRNLKARLPRPLQDSLAGHFKNLPENADSSRQGLAARMQGVVSILDTIQKFDGVAQVFEEVRTLADGSVGAVQTLYLGLGAAYFLSESDEDAGFGVPSDKGWSWVSRPEIAEAVKEAIAMIEQKTEARFVPLPVQGLKQVE